ncbi:MAG TPA: peptide chain release factor 2 [Clostridiales bacterium]|nr:peptide chain release factor 2 [Clostridiales bacterium]
METLFDLAKLQNEIDGLLKRQSQEDFYKNLNEVKEVNQKLKILQDKVNSYKDITARADEIEELIELAEAEEDEALADEIIKDFEILKKDIEKLNLKTLLKGEYDAHNAIITLHAGAGGTEAQDWTEMLYRMYSRYAEKNNFAVKVIDYLEGDGAGIKSVTFIVEGSNAYGYLKAEKGVHRLVRISPFDANSRRHTSFASVEVAPEIEQDTDIEIKPDELKIDTYRSGGAGGQHVNKTESAVRITHIPTGIVVQCQNERSQTQNKETAMKMLISKLVELKERENQQKAESLKGEIKKIEWGSQIRSYVFCPYTLVKDHRTGYEDSDVQAVMDGEIDEFINDYLRKTQ